MFKISAGIRQRYEEKQRLKCKMQNYKPKFKMSLARIGCAMQPMTQSGGNLLAGEVEGE